jgi:hypothetical protein
MQGATATANEQEPHEHVRTEVTEVTEVSLPDITYID